MIQESGEINIGESIATGHWRMLFSEHEGVTAKSGAVAAGYSQTKEWGRHEDTQDPDYLTTE